MMRKHSAAVTPGVAKIAILQAIDPAEYATREELMRAARGAIAEALPEEMRPVS
jgi:1-acyl-sn-glycerol-3-phosphate acyltransferase